MLRTVFLYIKLLKLCYYINLSRLKSRHTFFKLILIIVIFQRLINKMSLGLIYFLPSNERSNMTVLNGNGPLTFSRMDVWATSQSNSITVYTQENATPTVRTKNTPPTLSRSSSSAELAPPFS